MKVISGIILKLTLIVMSLSVLFISFISLPKIASEMAISNPEFAFLQYPLLIGIWLTLIPFHLALYKTYLSIHQFIKARATTASLTITLSTIFYSALSIIVLYAIGLSILIASQAVQPGIMLFSLLVIAICILIMACSRFIGSYVVKPYIA